MNLLTSHMADSTTPPPARIADLPKQQSLRLIPAHLKLVKRAAKHAGLTVAAGMRLAVIEWAARVLDEEMPDMRMYPEHDPVKVAAEAAGLSTEELRRTRSALEALGINPDEIARMLRDRRRR